MQLFKNKLTLIMKTIMTPNSNRWIRKHQEYKNTKYILAYKCKEPFLSKFIREKKAVCYTRTSSFY